MQVKVVYRTVYIRYDMRAKTPELKCRYAVMYKHGTTVELWQKRYREMRGRYMAGNMSYNKFTVPLIPHDPAPTSRALPPPRLRLNKTHPIIPTLHHRLTLPIPLQPRNLPIRLLKRLRMIPHILHTRLLARLLRARLVPLLFRTGPLSAKRNVEDDLEVLEALDVVAAAAGEVRDGRAPFGWVGRGAGCAGV